MEDFGADAGTVRMPPPLLYACPVLLPMAAEVVLPERLTDDMPEV